MCRIAGLVNTGLQAKQINGIVNTMCNALQHGGPDDAGIFTDEKAGLAFGHRRLSIIDLSSNGHQPMADIEQRARITFNGEIYNYKELKKELLDLGATFASDTDTEVIIQSFLFWGTASFARLRGMFAFALYHIADQTVYLVRDTAGIKPLYYHINGQQLAFASEIKAFKAAGINTGDDERWPVWLLAFGNIPEPYTTLKDTFSLPKGTYLCRQKNGSHTIQNYNPPVPINYITDAITAQQGLQTHLQDAVNRQLIADAPIGVFLSGGVDSSIITLLAAQQKQQQLKTISIFFDEKKYDERSFQDTVLRSIPGENFKHLVKQQDLDTFLPQIISAMDMPTTDGINSWFISKYAREAGLKAVLSGIGADELFGGYPSFNRVKYLQYLRKIPPFLFTGAGILNGNSYKRFTYLKHDHPAADYLFMRGLYTTSDIAAMLDMDERNVNQILFSTNNLPNLGPYDKLHAEWFETNMYMQNQLLRDTDVMSMAHGLEVRVPFLDEDFLQFARQIHPGIRFGGAMPKQFLIDSFKHILPEPVWNRKKMGFSFPLEDWMRRNKSICDETFYSGKAAKKLIRNFKNGKIHWSRAFALYQVQQHA